MQCHKIATVKHIEAAPRLICKDQLLLIVGCAVIICRNNRLELVQSHAALGIHGYDTICYIQHAVNVRKSATRSIITVCPLRIAHRRRRLGKPRFLAPAPDELPHLGSGMAGVMTSYYIHRGKQLTIAQHLSCCHPGTNFVGSHYLDPAEIIRSVIVTLKCLGKIFYPVYIDSALVAVSTNIVKLKAVGLVGRYKSVLIPLVACFHIIGGIRHPSRLAPPQHIQCKIRVYALCISRKTEACTTCDIGFFVLETHYTRLCT